MTRSPDKTISVQVFKGEKWELTFERVQHTSQTRYNILLIQNGRKFEAKEAPEELYNIFLSQLITEEKDLADTVQDLVVLLSK